MHYLVPAYAANITCIKVVSKVDLTICLCQLLSLLVSSFVTSSHCECSVHVYVLVSFH